jgi:hypothetical protein
MVRKIREPIQVCLTASERAQLDRAAGELGVSRSEVLRRGMTMAITPGSGPLARLVSDGIVTPSKYSGRAIPPPSAPVSPLVDVLSGLDEDREEE